LVSLPYGERSAPCPGIVECGSGSIEKTGLARVGPGSTPRTQITGWETSDLDGIGGVGVGWRSGTGFVPVFFRGPHGWHAWVKKHGRGLDPFNQWGRPRGGIARSGRAHPPPHTWREHAGHGFFHRFGPGRSIKEALRRQNPGIAQVCERGCPLDEEAGGRPRRVRGTCPGRPYVGLHQPSRTAMGRR